MSDPAGPVGDSIGRIIERFIELVDRVLERHGYKKITESAESEVGGQEDRRDAPLP